MRAEDLKEWLSGGEDEKRVRKKGEARYESAGGRWRLLVKLCEHIWLTGEIPQQMLLAVVSLFERRAQAATTRALASLRSFRNFWRGFWMPGSRR